MRTLAAVLGRFLRHCLRAAYEADSLPPPTDAEIAAEQARLEELAVARGVRPERAAVMIEAQMHYFVNGHRRNPDGREEGLAAWLVAGGQTRTETRHSAFRS